MSSELQRSESSDRNTKDEKSTKHSTSQSERSLFDPDVITEDDIERIWAKMKKLSANNRKYRRKRELHVESTDMTPTTDYDGMCIPLHPETFEEELEMDKKMAKMEEVLRTKRAKPKTYLTQVILYDNVSHQRLLEQKLHILHHRHKMVERNMKRKKETFIQQLESKQNEWTRLDARVAKKFEPEKMPDLTFKFGQLYHSADYPYQAAINSLKGIQVSKSEPMPKIQILPQVTFRKAAKPNDSSDSDSGTSRIFITRLPKKNRMNKAPSPMSGENSRLPQKDKTSWERQEPQQKASNEMYRPMQRGELAPVRVAGGRRLPNAEKNWIQDSRYITLTSLLGERFSPKKRIRGHNATESNLAW